jgi:hypothetical protein
VLKPLKYTPKYHVIYEVDDGKAYGDIDGPEADRSPQSIDRAIRNKEFLDKLPKEDPEHKVRGYL